MKKSIIITLTIFIFIGTPLNAQFGKFINKVSKSVANEITGKPDESSNGNNEPEPKCACETPDPVLDLGKVKLMFSEINLSVSDDGALLVKDRTTGDFYIAKDGTTQGPLKAGDPKLKAFREVADVEEDSNGEKTWSNEYITKTNGKYLIKFDGKSYGPFGVIRQFKVSRSKDKFVAEVIENVPVSAEEGDKMDEAIKNAKTEQEKMDLAMQYSQQMAQKIQAGGGAMSTVPKIVSSIPNVTFDLMQHMGATLNSSAKYNDIILTTNDKVYDLSGKVLINLKPDAQFAENLFVNSSNTKYAYYKYGVLTFSDGTVLSEMFNSRLAKINGEIFMTYMYYSPKNNAIMQCKLPF